MVSRQMTSHWSALLNVTIFSSFKKVTMLVRKNESANNCYVTDERI